MSFEIIDRELFARARLVHGFTVDSVAARSGVARTTIYKAMREGVSPRTIDRIAISVPEVRIATKPVRAQE